MHRRVLDRDGRLAGDGGQHVQVFLEELLAVAGVELDDPQGFAVGGQERHAHDRADLQVGDRGAGRQVLVGAGVLAEHRLLLAQDVVDDRPADAHRDLVGRDDRREDRLRRLGRYLNALRMSRLVSGSTRIRKSRSACGNSSISESRILGATASIFSSLERLRAISRIALSLTSGLTMLARALEREASSVWSWAGPRVVALVDDHDVARFLRGAVRRELRVEQELDVADIDPVARREAVVDSRDDLGVVDLGHVPGVEVGQVELLALAIDLGMPAADAVGVEDDVAMLGRTADDDSIGLQLDDLPGGIAVGSFQECHALRLPTRNRRRGPFS